MRGPLMNINNYTPNMTCYEEVVAKLNAFFLPKENSTYERHLLCQMKQKTDESIDAFIVRLRVQAERCGFGDRIEENVKDQIIENCQSAALRRELLKRGDADLQEVLRIAKIFETVAVQEKSFTREAIKPQTNEANRVQVNSSYVNKNRPMESAQVECHRCEYFGHMARDEKCPAKGKLCNKCNGRDHFAKKFRKRKHQMSAVAKRDDISKVVRTSHEARNQDSSTVHQIVDTDTEYVFNVTTTDNDGEVQCEIGGVTILAVIDSGSKYKLLAADEVL
ncbi:uncharacterized protein LOC129769260 [Toxorhynchites rutilus septentrionalis]|uniref:uncharacterized protein LOC129769260 n=1 Tax=Toxorhynchites rutilus septentrionalis TaxID=329112 RepID=UPI00247A49A8|nr:uncharacterized protein LOC129769260 [Toxorhynchites rutilus septentrionalis]XP_055627356.1 uncharacterized protein LOC129769260 [Toxorhynchites rutilus septentrionalis]XP_055627357.1 uncharacterized protein LOC129769260 [Toxorhynchites rutilus septentrionalis]XP_055627359.1 uncharacterized protein LOC129769260 [Toxorhynchites rutilus septentrionalis]